MKSRSGVMDECTLFDELEMNEEGLLVYDGAAFKVSVGI